MMAVTMILILMPVVVVVVAAAVVEVVEAASLPSRLLLGSGSEQPCVDEETLED